MTLTDALVLLAAVWVISLCTLACYATIMGNRREARIRTEARSSGREENQTDSGQDYTSANSDLQPPWGRVRFPTGANTPEIVRVFDKDGVIIAGEEWLGSRSRYGINIQAEPHPQIVFGDAKASVIVALAGSSVSEKQKLETGLRQETVAIELERCLETIREKVAT